MDSWRAWKVFSLFCFSTLIRTTDSHILSHDDARSINGPEAQSFVDSLFGKYGTNESMNLQQFGTLLKELKVGSVHAKGRSESARGNKEKKGTDKVRYNSLYRIPHPCFLDPVGGYAITLT